MIHEAASKQEIETALDKQTRTLRDERHYQFTALQKVAGFAVSGLVLALSFYQAFAH